MLESVLILLTKLVGNEGCVGVLTVTIPRSEFPFIFVAVTVNVYNVSVDNPVNVNVLVDASVVADKLPGDAVILYPVTGLLPSEAGALHETVQSQSVLEIFVILVTKLVGEEGETGALLANNARVRADC